MANHQTVCGFLGGFVVAVLCGSGFSPTTASDDWPAFRGPTGDGVSTATNLPVEFSDTMNVRWKVPVPGKAWSSPVVLGGKIWLTNAPEDGKQLSFVCIDLNSGKTIFDRVLFEQEKPAFCHPFNSHASCTAALEPGRAYIHFGSAGTACVDAESGATLWTRQDLLCDHFRGAGASPVIYKDLLILNFDGFDVQYICALDKATGKTVWKKDREVDYNVKDGDMKKAYGTPAVVEVDGKDQLVSSFAGFTISYEPLTGKEIWRIRHGGMNASIRPIFAHDLLYLNTADGGDLMLTVRPKGATGDITATGAVWKKKEGVPKRPGYIIAGDLLFMINDAGIATCLDAKTGEKVWQHRFGGNFTASPILAEGRIYCFGQEGQSPVFKASREFEQLADNHLEEGVMSSPAAVGQSLIVRTKSHLYRFTRDGK